MRRIRAVDLYSGVGGWSLGLSMAGIDVVASYDIWQLANETNRRNNGHECVTVDLRNITLSSLPSDIDVVVGSPPCTQFSLSNRGGSGSLADGIADIEAFLRVVRRIKPKAWVFENVPGAMRAIEAELRPEGCLHPFRSLISGMRIFELETFGLPQRRRRCLIGNIDFDLLASYRQVCNHRTLGDVLTALSGPCISDPVYGGFAREYILSDHQIEPDLDAEEVRINSANKLLHPVYNRVAFPEPLERPVRTITATCTRVSRESVVVENPQHPGRYRRLTIRERACLQSFPLDFQFHGNSHSQKLKMVGNAMPPLFAFYIGHAVRGTRPKTLPVPVPDLNRLAVQGRSRSTPPEKAGHRFPSDRVFRFAIPSLRLKSGVRFELSNKATGKQAWSVRFTFGTPKSIHRVPLTSSLFKVTLRGLPSTLRGEVHKHIAGTTQFISEADILRMQSAWSRRSVGDLHPFALLDVLDQAGHALTQCLRHYGDTCTRSVERALRHSFPEVENLAGVSKLYKHSDVIVAGLLLGSAVNPALSVSAMTTSSRRERASITMQMQI